MLSKWQACLLLITYSNSQRKTHKIAQIRHVEPQKRQHRTIELGSHLFWALTWPFLDISLRYKTLQYSSIHFFIFQTNNQTRRLCGSLWKNRANMAARSEYFRSYHLPMLSAEQNDSQSEEINEIDESQAENRPVYVQETEIWWKKVYLIGRYVCCA